MHASIHCPLTEYLARSRLPYDMMGEEQGMVFNKDCLDTGQAALINIYSVMFLSYLWHMILLVVLAMIEWLNKSKDTGFFPENWHLQCKLAWETGLFICFFQVQRRKFRSWQQTHQSNGLILILSGNE